LHWFRHDGNTLPMTAPGTSTASRNASPVDS